MSGLRPDMSGRYQICLVKQDNTQHKSRSGAKMTNLGPDKITTNKQHTIEHIEVNRATRCNIFTRNHT
jgi:hypothetical protein